MTQRIPPHFAQGEKAVIAACMLDNGCIPRVRAVLEPEDFYLEKHRQLFRVLCQLDDRQRPVDLVTVVEQLNRFGRLDDVGGQTAIIDLVDAAPSAANVLHYAEAVKDKAVRRTTIVALNDLANRCYSEDQETDDIQADLQKTAFSITTKTVKKGLVKISSIVPGSVKAIEHAKDRGLPSGLKSIDYYTRGFRPSELVFIGGRPSMGKSALVADFVMEGVRHTTVAVFSLEMSEDELTSRLISKIANVDLHRLRAGFVADHEWPRITEAMATISDMALVIDDSGTLTVSQIRARVQEASLRLDTEIGLIVVDYLQLMKAENRHSSLNERVSELTRGLKTLAKDLRTRVICLSQLNRQLEQRPFKGHERRPRMSDFRDSGSVEADADIMLALYRPEVYSEDEKYKGLAEACILKQRNGPTGIAHLQWYPKTATFTDPIQEDSEPEYPSHWQDKEGPEINTMKGL